MSTKDFFPNVIRFSPEKIDIVNFQQGKTYTEPITLSNCVDVPLVLKIKTSDSQKITLSDSSIKILPHQSKEIRLTIREEKGIKIINEKKRLLLWVKGDLVEEKYIIELQYNSNTNMSDNRQKIPYHYPNSFEKEYTSFGFIGFIQPKSNNNSRNQAKERKENHNYLCQWNDNLTMINQGSFDLGRSMDYNLIQKQMEENMTLKGTLERIMNQYQEMSKLIEFWSRKAQKATKQFDSLAIEYMETLYVNGNMDDIKQYTNDALSLKMKEIEIENKVLILENNTLKLRMNLIGNKQNSKERHHDKEQEHHQINSRQGLIDPISASNRENLNKSSKEEYYCDLEFDYSKNKTIEEMENSLTKRSQN